MQTAYSMEGFTFLPDFLEEQTFLAHLYAHFDESGKYKEHPIISIGGIVDGFDRWRAMSDAWAQLLREYQVTELHAVRALRCSEPFGNTGRASGPEERQQHIIRFVRAAVQSLNGLAIAVTVDVRAYAKVSALHALYGDDPHYFAFYLAINNLLRHFTIPKHLTIGLIFDDEQGKAMRCYELLKKLKRNIPEVKERITSICFHDDKGAPPVQLADLFVHLSRREAMRIFADKPYQYRDLFYAFAEKLPNGQHLCMDAGFYDETALRQVAAEHVRLPGGIPAGKK